MHSIFDMTIDHTYHVYLLDLKEMDINGIFTSREAIELQFAFKKELNSIDTKLRKLKGGYNTLIHKILMASRYMFVISQYALDEETIQSWKDRRYFVNSTEAKGADLLNSMTMLSWSGKIPRKW